MVFYLSLFHFYNLLNTKSSVIDGPDVPLNMHMCRLLCSTNSPLAGAALVFSTA